MIFLITLKQKWFYIMETQKALSIKQPWAWLIVNGYKHIENRKWRTNYRGHLLIHAPMKDDKEGYKWVRENTNIVLPAVKEIERGGIVGSVKLVSVVTEDPSIWFFGPFGFVLEKQCKSEFIPLKGKLGIFNVAL